MKRRDGSIPAEAVKDGPPPNLSQTANQVPGELLLELMQARGMSARELARRCGRSAKLLVEIIAGKASIEPETALQLSRVLDRPADYWLRLESEYRLKLAGEVELSNYPHATLWASQFPLKELRARNLLPADSDGGNVVSHLLKLFGAGTISACRERFNELASVSYRHSPSFKSSEGALLTWLRLGERAAEMADASDYDRKSFLAALIEIRSLTVLPLEQSIPIMTKICSNSGVIFIIEQPFSGVSLSGVSRWLTARRALIQQTLRYKSNDHFWFTFFHEAAHLLLHSRKTVFLDGGDDLTASNPAEEVEANTWAASFLVNPSSLNGFLKAEDLSKSAVERFALGQGIAPGIVVGQLQKSGAIPYSRFNDLKVRFTWT